MSVESKITPTQAVMSYEQKKDAIIDAEESQRSRKEIFYQGVAVWDEALRYAGRFGMYFILVYYPLTRGTDFGEWTRAAAAITFATLAEKGTETVSNKLDTIKSNRRRSAIREASNEIEEKLDPQLSDLIKYVSIGDLIDEKYRWIK